MSTTATGRNGREQEALAVGNLTLDFARYRVLVDDQPVVLTYREFDLLALLARQPDRMLPFDVLTHALWGSTGKKDRRHLNVLVHRLRSKLTACSPYRIDIVRNRGYGLVQ